MGLRGIWILWITLSGERIGLLILCCITVGIWCRKFISLATPLETRKLMKKPWPLKLCEVFGRWCGLSAGHKQREANSYRWEDPLTIQEVWMIFHSTVPSSKENRRLKSMLKQGTPREKSHRWTTLMPGELGLSNKHGIQDVVSRFPAQATS